MARNRTYDHRLKTLIYETKNPNLFPMLRIPRSTALGWIRNGLNQVVSHESLDYSRDDLISKISSLEIELAKEKSKQELSTFTFKLFGLEIQYVRLPPAKIKESLLNAIQKAGKVLSLNECLILIGLSNARFHAWKKRLKKCTLKDQASCPKSFPTKLNKNDIDNIKELVTSEKLIHFSVNSVSWLGKRTGKIFASPTTWSKVIKEYKLKRPSKRHYPPKPKIGVRASFPGQIWHLDITIIKLLDGTRTFTQAIIDNYSRCILAYATSLEYGGVFTSRLIERAIINSQNNLGFSITPDIFVDSGVENLNKHVDKLVKRKLIKRTVAQIDISFSNSMVECFFRRLKHGYLYLQQQSNFTTLQKHIDFYVKEYNEKIPHSALAGGTPLEVFSGKWNKNLLDETTKKARLTRLIDNKCSRCRKCQ